jgi:hypothetical protein
MDIVRPIARVALFLLLIVVCARDFLLAAAPAANEKKPSAVPAITAPTLFNTPEADAVVAAMQIFPPDNAWNADISKWPLHPDSAKIVESSGGVKPLRDKPHKADVLVPPGQKKVDVELGDYSGESDAGPFPIPDNMPIEGWPRWFSNQPNKPTLDDVQRDKAGLGGDRHAIVVDPAARMLYEFYAAKKTDAGWQVAQSSRFDLASNQLRPADWTSSDAAGLPIFPSIVRYDELKRGVINHAMRVTVVKTRRAYVAPARHFASNKTDPHLPRMGERLRLKADIDVSRFSPSVKTILLGLQKHGMLVADNGIDWAISVAPDERIDEMNDELRKIKGSAFEVVEAPR